VNNEPKVEVLSGDVNASVERQAVEPG